jgi:hypothetical protein
MASEKRREEKRREEKMSHKKENFRLRHKKGSKLEPLTKNIFSYLTPLIYNHKYYKYKLHLSE